MGVSAFKDDWMIQVILSLLQIWIKPENINIKNFCLDVTITKKFVTSLNF